MPGTAVLAEVRARHPRIPVLLASGLGDVTLGLADGFLQKPFTPNGLLTRVREMLDARAVSGDVI